MCGNCREFNLLGSIKQIKSTKKLKGVGILIKTTSLGGRAWLHEIESSKFKINRISINFVCQFQPDAASQNTALALMLTKQCAKFPSTQLLGRKLKELYGAVLDSNCTKFGDLQLISFSIMTVDDSFTLGGEPLLESAFDLLCEAIFNPKVDSNGALAKQTTEIEKQNLIELISNELSNKQKLAQLNATKLLFKNENCAHPSFGSIEQAQQINQNNLTQAYRALLENSQIHIMFSNKANAEKIKNVFLKHCTNSSLNNCIELENKPFLVQSSFNLRKQTDCDEISQAHLILSFAAKQPITFDQIPAVKTMVALLGGTPTSKLFSVVREQLSLCYYCAASFNAEKKVIWIISGVSPKNTEHATSAILNQLNELKQGSFSNEELAESKQHLTNNLNLINDNISKLESFFLRKILENKNKNSNSISSELETINDVNSAQIVQAANLFHHASTYILTSK